jgi:DNA-binding transcriptional LysR family regulator
MAILDATTVAARDTRHEPMARPLRPGRGAMDWNDVQVFLAVAREGSMRAAGRALGLSQPTIARRLAAFEASFGGPALFDRLPEGLRLNATGERLISAAEGIEDAVLTLERRSAAASPMLSGTVRVSTGECAAGFLARCLSDATTTALPSGISLELVDELRQTANLVRRQADMALRHEPPEGGDFYIPRRALLPAPSTVVATPIVGHLYRRASPLCACTMGPAAGGRDRESGDAARIIDADAFGGDPRRYRARRATQLCGRRPSSA